MTQFIDFGHGGEGALSIGTSNLGGVGGFGIARFSGTAGNNYGTIADVGYFNGTNGGRVNDTCFIHQSQGAGAGQWELVKIINRVSTTIYFDRALTYTYINPGAQILTAPNLYNGTITGTISTYTAWADTAGGCIFLLDRGTLTINGTVAVNGTDGIKSSGTGNTSTTSGGGFRGGSGNSPGGSGSGTVNCGCGEGYNDSTGLNNAGSTAANENGGGGAYFNSGATNGVSGGGGGNGTAGGTATGIGGSTAGNDALTNMVFGGGGGGGGCNHVYQDRYSGGSGGGLILIIANKLIVNNPITVNGGNTVHNSGDTLHLGAGGGAGGSILIKAQEATLGTGLITATGGTSVHGGAGGSGRIHLDYYSSYTGTTSPSLTATRTTALANAGGGQFLTNFL